MKGEEHSRYFCADKKDDILKIMAAVVEAKVYLTGCTVANIYLIMTAFIKCTVLLYISCVPHLQYTDCLESPVLPVISSSPPPVRY